MASRQIVSELQEEVTCPICLNILQNPVTIDCGHNFCLECITRSEDTSSGLLVCSLCKKSVNRDMLRPNWLLINLVEKIQVMSTSEMQPESEKLRCQKHQEKIHYFCEHDGKFLCTVCLQSKDHSSHKISLLEEAAPNYQGQIESQLKDLQQKETTILQGKARGEQKVKVFMDQVDYEEQRITREFKHLHQVLKKEKKFLLLRLSWLGQEGEKEGHLFSASVEAQLNSLSQLIDSLKAKQQMPPSDLLWDIQEVLFRSQEFQCLHPTAISPDLQKKLSEVKLRHDSITETLKKFRENFQADGKKDRSRNFRGMSEDMMKSWHLLENDNSKRNKPSKLEPISPAPVILDAASAHPDLVLSQDLKTVTLDLVPSGCSEEPTDPERFYPFRCVLGSPGLCSGRHSWEVELGGPGGGACVMGVASEQVSRRGFLTLEPVAGYWVLRIAGSECQALLDGHSLDLPVRPSRVGVRVDYERREIVFYDTTTSTDVYTFHACFPGRIFPFFQLLFPGTKITLSP